MTCNTIRQWTVSLTILICFQIIYSNIAMIRNEIRKILSYYFAKVGRCLCWARCAVERRQIAKFAGHLNFTDNQNPPFKNGIFHHPFLDGFYALGSTLRKPTFPYIIAVLFCFISASLSRMLLTSQQQKRTTSKLLRFMVCFEMSSMSLCPFMDNRFLTENYCLIAEMCFDEKLLVALQNP